MKKKLIRVAEQIKDIEQKLQAGENMAENFSKLEKITSSLSDKELCEIDEYLQDKFKTKKII